MATVRWLPSNIGDKQAIRSGVTETINYEARSIEIAGDELANYLRTKCSSWQELYELLKKDSIKENVAKYRAIPCKLPSLSTAPECPICLDGIAHFSRHADEMGKGLDCTHLFHAICINKWLAKNDSCPLCRAKVTHVVPRESSPGLRGAGLLIHIRHEVRAIRARRLDLNENSQVARTARTVNSLAGRLFGFGF